jgi:hypothetical protein
LPVPGVDRSFVAGFSHEIHEEVFFDEVIAPKTIYKIDGSARAVK